MITGYARRVVERFVRRVEGALIYIDRPHSPTARSIREGLAEIKRELNIQDRPRPLPAPPVEKPK